jgi:proline dehydrogenase
MEGSAHTEVTLDIFETLWKLGDRNVGVVLQSCLHRTERDFERVNALGARIRLVKGAYREPGASRISSSPMWMRRTCGWPGGC